MWLGLFGKVHGERAGALPGDPVARALTRWLNLERGLALGGLIFLAGLGANLWLVHEWWAASLGELEPVRTMRGALWGLTGMVLGLQVAYGAFFLALLVQWPADSAGPQAGLIGP